MRSVKKKSANSIFDTDAVRVLRYRYANGADSVTLRLKLSQNWIFNAKFVIPVADWAKNNGINLQSATNKAIRGTIPAFRVRGHWMINSEYRKQDNVNGENKRNTMSMV